MRVAGSTSGGVHCRLSLRESTDFRGAKADNSPHASVSGCAVSRSGLALGAGLPTPPVSRSARVSRPRRSRAARVSRPRRIGRPQVSRLERWPQLARLFGYSKLTRRNGDLRSGSRAGSETRAQRKLSGGVRDPRPARSSRAGSETRAQRKLSGGVRDPRPAQLSGGVGDPRPAVRARRGSCARRGSPDPAGSADRRSPAWNVGPSLHGCLVTQSLLVETETFGQALRAGSETRAQRKLSGGVRDPRPARPRSARVLRSARVSRPRRIGRPQVSRIDRWLQLARLSGYSELTPRDGDLRSGTRAGSQTRAQRRSGSGAGSGNPGPARFGRPAPGRARTVPARAAGPRFNRSTALDPPALARLANSEPMPTDN